MSDTSKGGGQLVPPPQNPKNFILLLVIMGMDKILQIKITLKNIEPKIWRSFLVSDSWTFDKLHRVIQKVMGWEGYHLFEFKVKKEMKTDMPLSLKKMSRMDSRTIKSSSYIRITSSDEGYLEENEKDPKKSTIKDYLNAEKQKIDYVYDFGDTWNHEIIVEKIIEKNIENLNKYPICLEGQRACPPEDCGGTGGYERIIEALKTKKDPWGEKIQDLKSWLGNWNPENFNIEEVNKELENKNGKR